MWPCRSSAHNLVEVLRNLKSGYLEEMPKWAENGPTAENSYSAPIVQGIEAPLIKELYAEAHQRVKKTVQDIAQRKNLNHAHQMKEMRARLLVPLLLVPLLRVFTTRSSCTLCRCCGASF